MLVRGGFVLRALCLFSLHQCHSSVSFGEKEGSVDHLQSVQALEDSELDQIASELTQKLLTAPGVDASEETSQSIKATTAWMRQVGMLSCPSIYNALQVKVGKGKGSEAASQPKVTKAVFTGRGGALSDMKAALWAADADRKDKIEITPEMLPDGVMNANLPSQRKQYEQVLDDFITQHRWWNVESEPFEWQDLKDRKPLVLTRTPFKAGETWLKWMTRWQFVPQSECEKHPMALFNSDGAWGSFQQQYFQGFRTALMGGAIFQSYQKFWVTKTANQHVGWKKVANSFCPGTANPWLCYYLPDTNCSCPKLVDDCKTEPCVMKDRGYGTPNFYKPATADGAWMSDQAFHQQESQWKRDISVNVGNRRTVTRKKNPWETMPDGGFTPNTLTDVKHFVRPQFSEMRDRGLTIMYGMRWNTRMRGLLEEMIHHFIKQQSPVWDTSKPAVAIQIRRGDRVRGVTMDDMDKMCAAWEKNKHMYCRGGSCGDLGCGYPRETWWVGLTLDRYLQRAKEMFEKLPGGFNEAGGNNVFIMTDDGPWVKEQIKIHPIAKKFNIYEMSADPLEQRAFDKDEMRTRETLVFWASVAMCQKCNAFVGSWGSDVGKLVYRFMCAYHRGEYGKCPPATTMTVRL